MAGFIQGVNRGLFAGPQQQPGFMPQPVTAQNFAQPQAPQQPWGPGNLPPHLQALLSNNQQPGMIQPNTPPGFIQPVTQQNFGQPPPPPPGMAPPMPQQPAFRPGPIQPNSPPPGIASQPVAPQNPMIGAAGPQQFAGNQQQYQQQQAVLPQQMQRGARQQFYGQLSPEQLALRGGPGGWKDFQRSLTPQQLQQLNQMRAGEGRNAVQAHPNLGLGPNGGGAITRNGPIRAVTPRNVNRRP